MFHHPVKRTKRHITVEGGDTKNEAAKEQRVIIQGYVNIESISQHQSCRISPQIGRHARPFGVTSGHGINVDDVAHTDQQRETLQPPGVGKQQIHRTQHEYWRSVAQHSAQLQKTRHRETERVEALKEDAHREHPGHSRMQSVGMAVGYIGGKEGYDAEDCGTDAGNPRQRQIFHPMIGKQRHDRTQHKMGCSSNDKSQHHCCFYHQNTIISRAKIQKNNNSGPHWVSRNCFYTAFFDFPTSKQRLEGLKDDVRRGRSAGRSSQRSRDR